MDFNDILLLVVSIILISTVVVQSSKDSIDSAFSGEKSDLFKNKKQRGVELFMTRVTVLLAILYMGFAIWAMVD